VRAHLGNDEGAVVVTSHLWLTYAPSSGCAIGGRGRLGALGVLVALAFVAAIGRRRRPAR
jgi:hypothetical protein